MTGKIRRFSFLVLIPGIAALVVAVLFGDSPGGVAVWCAAYWWQLLLACALFYFAVRAFLFFSAGRALSSGKSRES